jgi:excisionase family DNA binding protein
MALTVPSQEVGLLTIDEAAAFLRISRAKAYQMAATGDLPTVRLGRSVRVRRDRLTAWLDECSSR